MTKELTINGELYAKYEFENSERLFLKVIKKQFYGYTGKTAESRTEDLIIELIKAYEGRNFKYVGYLNI